MRPAAQGLEVRPLFRGDGVRMEDVRCRPSAASCGEEEGVQEFGVAFVRRGLFVKHAGRRETPAGGNHIVLFSPDHTYRVSHPAPGGDDCTSFRFDAALVAEALGGPGAFGPDPVLDDARTALLHHALRRLALSGAADPLELEEGAMRLLRCVAVALRRQSQAGGAPRRRATSAWHRRLAGRTQVMLNLRQSDPLTLGAVARAVGSSPYHLARVFRREVGMPIHRYLNRLRLRSALGRIAEGGEPLAGIAFDAGFSSHAHLTDAFRREFGVAPAGFRRGLTASRLAQSSKILEAAGPASSVRSS